jgi:hypothetical protein
VAVHTSSPVAEVVAGGVRLADGRAISAELVVWAAGIKAPEVLRDLAGLETNRLNQLVVTPTLQTTRDPRIFAFGDCAACPWPEKEGVVPPRAQAAPAGLAPRPAALPPPAPYRYRDFGSLVSLGEYSTVGNMMGALVGGSLVIEGTFARLMYVSLYKMHALALHGVWKVAPTRRAADHAALSRTSSSLTQAPARSSNVDPGVAMSTSQRPDPYGSSSRIDGLRAAELLRHVPNVAGMAQAAARSPPRRPTTSASPARRGRATRASSSSPGATSPSPT